MDDIMEHLRQYKKAGQLCEDSCEDGSWAGMSPSTKAKQIERVFFEKEPSDDPWRAVCLSQPARLGEFEEWGWGVGGGGGQGED